MCSVCSLRGVSLTRTAVLIEICSTDLALFKKKKKSFKQLIKINIDSPVKVVSVCLFRGLHKLVGLRKRKERNLTWLHGLALAGISKSVKLWKSDLLCGNTISGHKARLCEFTARFFQDSIQQSAVVIAC